MSLNVSSYTWVVVKIMVTRNIRCRTILRTQTRTMILTTTHIQADRAPWVNWGYPSLSKKRHTHIDNSMNIDVRVYICKHVQALCRRLSIYLSIYLSMLLPIYLSVCLSIYPSTIYLSIYLSICLSVASPTFYPSLHPSIDLSTYVTIYVSMLLLF